MPKHQYGEDVYVNEVKVKPGKKVRLQDQPGQPVSLAAMIDKALRAKGK